MAKNWTITHIQGTKTILSGLTKISRNLKKSEADGSVLQYAITPTFYTLSVEVEHLKPLTLDAVKGMEQILELAFDSMAIRSSTYLLDRATDEKTIHGQLGDQLKRVEIEKDGKKTAQYVGGVLKLTYADLYLNKRPTKAPPTPEAMAAAAAAGMANKTDQEKLDLLKAMAAQLGLKI